jgi:hypothetical protein
MTDTVTTYDPAEGITYRHPDDRMPPNGATGQTARDVAAYLATGQTHRLPAAYARAVPVP